MSPAGAGGGDGGLEPPVVVVGEGLEGGGAVAGEGSAVHDAERAGGQYRQPADGRGRGGGEAGGPEHVLGGAGRADHVALGEGRDGAGGAEAVPAEARAGAPVDAEPAVRA